MTDCSKNLDHVKNPPNITFSYTASGKRSFANIQASSFFVVKDAK